MPDEKSQHFHHNVAQFMFLFMRARPYIQPLVALPTTTVRSLDEDDWGKLKQGMKYLKVTLYMMMYLHADSLNTICWWVDDSYGTHWDCKCHNGAVMLIGVGAILSLSRNQKLNTSISTKAELVDIYDMLV